MRTQLTLIEVGVAITIVGLVLGALNHFANRSGSVTISSDFNATKDRYDDLLVVGPQECVTIRVDMQNDVPQSVTVDLSCVRRESER